MNGGGYGGQQNPSMGSFGNRQTYGNQAFMPQRGGFQYQPQTGGEMSYTQRMPVPQFNPMNSQPQGKSLADFSNQNVAGFSGLLGQPQQAQEAPGFMVNQRNDVQPPPQPPQQSFEQFAATLGNNGMTSGQMQDAYQKSLQPQTNFWGNVGPGGTQNPYPTMGDQPFNPAWGKQTFNFDPRSMAGKQVTGDLGWYYGRDAIGRTINNQGDAVAGFSRPADGFQRSRPWFA